MAKMVRARLCMMLMIATLRSSSAFTDTAGWLGAAYTPSAAPNNWWWHWYEQYEPGIERELPMLKRRLGVTTLRTFLAWEVFEANPSGLHSNMERFLSVAGKSNITVGFVFFDDCWNHQGGSVAKQCTPRKGVHNGCWMASPQDANRVGSNASNAYTPLKAYVSTTVAAFKSDPRVQWWEVFNEPRRDNWSLGLRAAAFSWAKASQPLAPVISCWDDSNATDILDHHDYGTAFKSRWQTAIYSDVAKGAIGARHLAQPSHLSG